MAKRSFCGRVGKWLLVAAAGGSIAQVSGCDPTVRTTLLTGLEATTNSLAQTLISAFFISLQNNQGTGGSGTGLTTT